MENDCSQHDPFAHKTCEIEMSFNHVKGVFAPTESVQILDYSLLGLAAQLRRRDEKAGSSEDPKRRCYFGGGG